MSRHERRCFEQAVSRVHQYPRRPGGALLADSRRARQACQPAHHLRYELLEVVHPRPVRRGDRGPKLLISVRQRPQRSPHVRRPHDRGVPGPDPRPRAEGGRMEDSTRQAGQPLARLPGWLRRGGVAPRGGAACSGRRRSVWHQDVKRTAAEAEGCAAAGARVR
jgi:hypothetical protein